VPELRELPEPPADGHLLFVGELSPRKGFDLLLDAAPTLASEFGNVVVAGDGPLRSRTLAMARAGSGLRYLGFIEGAALAEAMASASILVLPSRRDPWPLVACEALVAGRPVVLGPGVGSKADLVSVAGDAVVSMKDATVGDLVAAARVARGRVVPKSARSAFAPQESAAAFVAAAM
jgi:glycosyltransferase involved in cell wall biosynthesis